MAVTSVTTNNYISETTLFLRDDLLANITDPISGIRPATEKFVMTSYPKRAVKYPLITVQVTNNSTGARMGMQSELHYATLEVEVRVWARRVTERDSLAQNVINRLRSQDLDLYVPGKLGSFMITSVLNVDEDGLEGLHSKVITIEYKFVLGE